MLSVSCRRYIVKIGYYVYKVLETDELIAKFDESNKLNVNLKNQFSSHVDKIKSLEEQLGESKTEVKK